MPAEVTSCLLSAEFEELPCVEEGNSPACCIAGSLGGAGWFWLISEPEVKKQNDFNSRFLENRKVFPCLYRMLPYLLEFHQKTTPHLENQVLERPIRTNVIVVEVLKGSILDYHNTIIQNVFTFFRAEFTCIIDFSSLYLAEIEWEWSFG